MNGKVKVRTDRKHALKFEGERGRSRTRQSFKRSTTVDAILKQYQTLGVDTDQVGVFRQACAKLPFGVSLDATGDYVTMLNRVRAVGEYFKALPSAVRESFLNDPANMLSWLSDPKNHDEARKLGILAAKGSGEPVAALSDPSKGPGGPPPAGSPVGAPAASTAK